MKRILLLLIPLLASCVSRPIKSDNPHWSAVELLREQHKGELTEWGKLILAISFTESRFNPDAVGKAGDSGHMQLVPIYVAEVNRLYGTSYTIEDAFDIDKSLEMFTLMQGYYNPGKDIDKAIYYHNKSSAYRATVLRNLEMIGRYETLRAKLIEQ